MDKSNGSSSETIKVGDVDITININHYDDDDDQPGGGNSASAQPPPVYCPPVRKRSKVKNVLSIIVICFCLLTIPVMFWSYSYVAPSTHVRRELPPGLVNETGYYTDEAGLIDDENTLLEGMKEFYKTTGIQPYIYITKTVNGSQSPTENQLQEFTDGLYGRLFTDEAHLLVVFLPFGNSYKDSFAYGSQADTFIDSEAESILRDYLNYYYSKNSYTNPEIFSKSFSDAADRMMDVTTSPWVMFFISAPTAALVAFFYIRRRKRVRKAQEDLTAQEIEDLLKIPLEKFGDLEAEELAKKYEDTK